MSMSGVGVPRRQSRTARSANGTAVSVRPSTRMRPSTGLASARQSSIDTEQRCICGEALPMLTNTSNATIPRGPGCRGVVNQCARAREDGLTSTVAGCCPYTWVYVLGSVRRGFVADRDGSFVVGTFRGHTCTCAFAWCRPLLQQSANSRLHSTRGLAAPHSAATVCTRAARRGPAPPAVAPQSTAGRHSRHDGT